MPTTALTFGNELLTTTAMAHQKKIRDVLHRPHAFLDDFMKNMETETGGERITIRYETNEHAATTRLITGFEPINMTVLPIGTPGHEAWGHVVRPVLISNDDDILNRGSHKILDLVKTRTESTEKGLRTEHHDMLLRGPAASGTHPGVLDWLDFITVNGTDSTTGFIEENAVAAQTNIVHNFSKATFSALPGTQNQRFDGAGSFSLNGLIGLQDITTRIAELTPDGTKLMGYQSLAAQGHLKRALQSQERFLSADKLDIGRPVLVYNGISLTPDSRLPNTGATTTADPWSVLILDFNAAKFVGQSDWIYKMTPFQDLTLNVRGAAMHVFGQNIMSGGWGSSGLLFDAEVW